MSGDKIKDYTCSQGVEGCSMSADGTLTCPGQQLVVAQFEYMGQPAPNFIPKDTQEEKKLVDILERMRAFGTKMVVPLCKLKILDEGKGSTDVPGILEKLEKDLTVSIGKITCDMNAGKKEELDYLDALRQQEFGQKN